MNIEVEIRSFLTKEQYEHLLQYFQNNATALGEDTQETYYFDHKEDLRIQRNNTFSKIWLKKGKIHDDAREEIEIKFDRDAFPQLEKLFLTLGLNVQIKWYRTRHTFSWNSITVSVDYTKGYGYILELEKMTTADQQATVLEGLKQKLTLLNIPLTPKAAFDQRYQHYKENWPRLIASSP